jgi:hypothetical protein
MLFTLEQLREHFKSEAETNALMSAAAAYLQLTVTNSN